MAQAHSRALSELCITMKTQMQVCGVCVFLPLWKILNDSGGLQQTGSRTNRCSREQGKDLGTGLGQELAPNPCQGLCLFSSPCSAGQWHPASLQSAKLGSSAQVNFHTLCSYLQNVSWYLCYHLG